MANPSNAFGQDRPRLAPVKSGAGGSFGQTPPLLTPEREAAAVPAPVADPVAQPAQEKSEPSLPLRPKRVIVDETVEKAVTVRHSTVIFRPGQVIIDPFVLKIANDNGVHLIEK